MSEAGVAPGAFGIRLEEIVQVTDEGCARFSSLS